MSATGKRSNIDLFSKQSAGVVSERYVLASVDRASGRRRVVAWAECKSDKESLLLVEEWFQYCAAVTPLASGCSWSVDLAKRDDIQD